MTAPVGPGDILAGKYLVERVLGEGGMGVVVSAIHQQLGQRVAVKFLLPEFCAHAEPVARFLREAQAAVRVQSEHVARVIDVGTLESGAPFMVMEFLSGRDLSSEIAARGVLPVEEAVSYVLQACEAIAEAHAMGIVHRDLKPANLFLTRRADGSPLVKVLDFGISKSTVGPGGAMNLTSTQSVMGSPLYMSPEQLKSSKNVDQRTDIWSLGVILHELVAGSPPFHAETVSALIVTVVSDPAPPLRSLRADAPPELEAVVLRCLEKDPARRVPHVGTLALALQALAPTQGAVSVPRIRGVLVTAGVDTNSNLGSLLPPQAETSTQAQTAAAFGQDTQPRERTSRTGVVVGAVVGVALSAVFGGFLALRAPSPVVPEGSGEPSVETARPKAPAPTLGAIPPPASTVAPSSSASASPVTSTASPIATERTAPVAAPANPRRATQPRTTAGTTVRPVPTPHPVTTARPRVDPLEGRR
ncbi:MAG: protein kinase [Polyangiaceae bacterium]|nr:protein kinase [Polyangiaceae bacterium]